MKKTLYLADVVTGMFAALAEQGIRTIGLRRNLVDTAFEETFPTMLQEAGKHGLDVRFRIKRHFIHGDSQDVRGEILSAMQRGIASVSVPGNELHINIKPEDAGLYFARLPGTPEMYGKIARGFMNNYRGAA